MYNKWYNMNALFFLSCEVYTVVYIISLSNDYNNKP